MEGGGEGRGGLGWGDMADGNIPNSVFKWNMNYNDRSWCVFPPYFTQNFTCISVNAENLSCMYGFMYVLEGIFVEKYYKNMDK